MNSLQNICLNYIADEFERFHFAFRWSNNKNLRTNLKFLQRKYSFELGSELYKRKKLKNEEYTRFCLNRHLKFLMEEWVYNSTFYKCSKEYAFSRLPNLTKIFCHHMDDELLENIAKFCPNIVEIDTDISYVTDKGVNYLCKKQNGSVPCPNLKKLIIRESSVTDKGIMNLLRDLKSLEKLDPHRVPSVLYSMHKRHLDQLEKIPCYNLDQLVVYDFELMDPDTHTFRDLPSYYDLFKICLTLCPKLKSLSCAILCEEQLNFLNIFLEELDLVFNQSKEEIDVDSFLKNSGRNLTDFSVIYCMMSIRKLAVSCPKLKYLSVEDVSLSDDHSDSVAIFHFLVHVTFSEIEIQPICLCLLSSPRLEEARFFDCEFSPNMKTYFLECCHKYRLKSLSFSECSNIDEIFVKDVLLCCPSLQTLKIRVILDTEKDALVQFAELLPNKPRIEFFNLH